MSEAIFREAPPTLHLLMAGLTSYIYLRRANSKLSAYVDVFVDYFLGLAQGPAHRQRRLWQTLFHYIYKVFRTCESGDSSNRKEVLSLKKLVSGDCTCSTSQVLLGWVINMVNMKLFLPPQRENRFKEILGGVPSSQKRIGV